MNFFKNLLDYFDIQNKCVFCKAKTSHANNPICKKCASEHKNPVISPAPPPKSYIYRKDYYE